MYNGIGLQTPRGSGTNGYIQSNKFFVKPRTTTATTTNNTGLELELTTVGGVKKANKDILEHDRKRDIELKLLILQETLADQGYTDAEISEKLEQTRNDLLLNNNAAASASSLAKPTRFSDTQTHQVAARKEKQLETLRAALGIKHSDVHSEHEVQDQKQEAEAPSTDNEESDREINQHQKKDSKYHDSVANEEKESLKKGNQNVVGKTVKDPKNQDWERRTDDNRGFNRPHDRENEKGKYRHSSDSEESGRYEERGKKIQDDFEKSSRQSIKNVSNKLRGSSKHHETESSDSDSYSSKEDARKHAKKHITKQKRVDIDSNADKKNFEKHRANNGRSDSDGSDFDGGRRKENARKHIQKHNERQRRVDNYSDSDLDEEQLWKQRAKNQRSDADGDNRMMTVESKKHGGRHVSPDSGKDNKRHGRDGRRHDSDQAETDNGRKNLARTTEKISKTSRRHENDETRKRDAKNEKDIKMNVSSGKALPEVTKRKESERNVDDDSSNSERGRKRTVNVKGQLSGKHQQHSHKRKLSSVTNDRSSSDSGYSSDTDSSGYNQARHDNRKAGMDLNEGKNDNVLSKKHKSSSADGFGHKMGRRHDGGEDRIANQDTGALAGKSSRMRNVDNIQDLKSKTAGSKEERKREEGIRGHASHSRSLGDQREGNRKLVVKEHPSDDKHGSKSHTEYDQGHVISKKRRYSEYDQSVDDRKKTSYRSPERHRGQDSYEHKFGEDSGRHVRRR